MHTTSNHNTYYLRLLKLREIIVATLIPYSNPAGNTEKLDRNDASTQSNEGFR